MWHADSLRHCPLCCCRPSAGRKAGEKSNQPRGRSTMARTAARKRDPGKGAPRRTAAQGGQVQSLDRALSILERLAEEDGMTLTDLAQSVGLAPSTTHRLPTTLHQRRFADFDERSAASGGGKAGDRTGRVRG